MATSKVDIFNLALTNISARAFVESLTEDSNERKYCSANYDHAVKTVLADCDWNFASDYETLALTAETAQSPWVYQYTYPSGCLNVREIVKASDDTPPVGFRVDLDAAGTGKVIHTDQQDAVLRFTKLVLTPELFTPACVDAVAWKLSQRIVIPLTHKQAIKQICDEGYERSILKAKAINHNEGSKRDDPKPDTILSRS